MFTCHYFIIFVGIQFENKPDERGKDYGDKYAQRFQKHTYARRLRVAFVASNANGECHCHE